MRKMLFPLVLLAACSPDATAPTAPIDPFLDPTLAVDYTMPAPTDVSAAVVQVLDRRRSSVRVTWTDNSTYVD
ncbi:MAG TPA: hypothetical protein VFZ21_09210, partial [Gemmatimonadaceae bacterium]|nr:hypothetical protein [Gemmatimonadaceae bacterium]